MIDEKNGSKVAVMPGDTLLLTDIQSALDLIATVLYEFDCNKILLPKQSICEDFFDLRTCFAGEILQKYTNYGVIVAIVGDFSIYLSKSLQDFIYESNKGKQIIFCATNEEALIRLHSL